MHCKRLAVGVAVVNRLLYAIGGFDGENRLNSVECYHPENNAWTLVPEMKFKRSGAGVSVLNQYIYVVGGFDGTTQLSAVERYDTDKQQWEEVKSMRIARSALSVNVIDGKLYAMGGYNGTQFLCDVEVYDPAKDQWEDGIALTSGRSGLASAVIYQPSCVNSYMDCNPTSYSTNREYDDDRKQPDFDPYDKKLGDSEHGNAGTSNHHNTTHYFNACSKSKKCLAEHGVTVLDELIPNNPNNPNIYATDSSFKCTLDDSNDSNLTNEQRVFDDDIQAPTPHCPIAKLKAKFNRFILAMIKSRRARNAERSRNCKTSECSSSSRCKIKWMKRPN